MSAFKVRSEAFAALIDMLARGHESVNIDFDSEDRTFDVYPGGRDIAPDYVGWTYADGLDIPEAASDHSRLLESCESLDTEAQFRYHMPALEEWFASDNPAPLTVEWSPVEDSSLQYDEESGAYRDEDDQLVEDNLVGHIYLMRVWI